MFICCSYRVTVVGLCSPYCFSLCSVARSHPTLLQPHGKPARLLCPWDFPGRDTGVGCHFLLQGIFLSQGSNRRLLFGRRILYH